MLDRLPVELVQDVQDAPERRMADLVRGGRGSRWSWSRKHVDSCLEAVKTKQVGSMINNVHLDPSGRLAGSS
ncbi:hypothetical protein JCM10213v2_008712 [Rhodosporidiobolus nylandii]